jgi:hypothetical protein
MSARIHHSHSQPRVGGKFGNGKGTAKRKEASANGVLIDENQNQPPPKKSKSGSKQFPTAEVFELLWKSLKLVVDYSPPRTDFIRRSKILSMLKCILGMVDKDRDIESVTLPDPDESNPKKTRTFIQCKGQSDKCWTYIIEKKDSKCNPCRQHAKVSVQTAVVPVVRTDKRRFQSVRQCCHYP